MKSDSIDLLRKIQLTDELRIRKYESQWKYYLVIATLFALTILFGFYHYRMRTRVGRILIRKNDDLAIINEELRTSEAELQEVNATKNKFFSVLAHDLINPFNALLNFTEFLLLEVQKDSREKLREYAGIIYQTSKNLNTLLENLLEWSRTQQNKIDHHPEIIELARFTNSNLSLLELAANKKDIRLEMNIPYQHKVYADTNMLNTVLRNLVQNAIKFTHPGGRVQVNAHVEKDEVVISVEDDGVGMTSEQLESLFELDRHPSTRGTANEEGTGLGLLLSKEFVEKNQGRIWVESKKSKGTVFHFTVPVA